MTRIIASQQALRVMIWRARVVPIASTVAGSCVALAPVLAPAPVLPPLGLMTMLSWRMLRPELWPSWVGLPLGAVDDLINGQPLGTSMCLWTVILLALDGADPRLIFRDWWHEWALAALALGLAMLGGVALGWLADGVGSLDPLLFPYLIAVLTFPVIARICAALDRWRLPR